MALRDGSLGPLVEGFLACCLISVRIVFSWRSRSRISRSMSRWELLTSFFVCRLAALAASFGVGFFCLLKIGIGTYYRIELTN